MPIDRSKHNQTVHIQHIGRRLWLVGAFEWLPGIAAECGFDKAQIGSICDSAGGGCLRREPIPLLAVNFNHSYYLLDRINLRLLIKQ